MEERKEERKEVTKKGRKERMNEINLRLETRITLCEIVKSLH